METQGLRLVEINLYTSVLDFQYHKDQMLRKESEVLQSCVPFLIDDFIAAYACLMRLTLFLATSILVHCSEEGGREGEREEGSE